MTTLEKIILPVQSEFAQCRSIYNDALSHENPLLNHILTDIGSHQGKMMRPLLVLLVAKLTEKTEKTEETKVADLAAAYEFFHTASLVHDDVVDDSDERRGEPSIKHLFNNKRAVLAGDYLLSLALHHISLSNDPRLVQVMSEAAASLANGELLQLNSPITKDIANSQSHYLKIIENKTAALFRACAQSGAISANATEEEEAQMRIFGEAIGMMFQIKDDVLDGEITPDLANQLIAGYQTTATDILLHYPDTPIRQALMDYTHHVVTRNY